MACEDRLQMGEVVSTIPTSKRHFFELFFCSKQWPQKVSHFTICCLHHGDGEKASLFTSFILAASSFGFLFSSDARFRTKTTKVRRGRIFINYDEFIEAVLTRWPKAIVQFEDFQMKWAFKTLKRYRERFCMFNDDVQVTAGVVLAGLLGTVREQG
ncbi:hypothetical protein ES332_D06G002300v1 [Gossypium tomentosum]|uniref:Malic enzyme N-terminal domain-containing protein n=1 Tax=Gossypium tomentosum TaxID=34277 RepID=A0A5D2KEZ6_GOSTO|nr:hypothetical protein ES332_D06G002300v1 [Gossypium tomentosum]